MNEIELVGGPLDGAFAVNRGKLQEGDHVIVDPGDSDEEGSLRAIDTFHRGRFEYDWDLTFQEED